MHGVPHEERVDGCQPFDDCVMERWHRLKSMVCYFPSSGYLISSNNIATDMVRDGRKIRFCPLKVRFQYTLRFYVTENSVQINPVLYKEKLASNV
jgi:hypothetical protein